MLANRPSQVESNVKFVSYDGKYPNLCNGTLVLEVCGKIYTWDKYSSFLGSGGNAFEGFRGEWEVDYPQIPDEIKKFATEIDVCINKHIEFGCCGGCR